MRINSLDGLRGIAILMVLLLHHALFNNGWIGVDLFFVLSGFLITGVLRKDRGKPHYWKRFYIKRAARILPPLFVTFLLVCLLTPNLSPLIVLGYVLTVGGVIDLNPAISIEPLGPLWSLAVEEHFYLAWPFAVRFLSKNKQLILLASLLFLTPLLRAAYSHPMATADLSVIYFLTPFRVDEMGMGCLLALLIEDERAADALKRWSLWLFLPVVALYLTIWQTHHHTGFYPGSHTKFFDSLGYTMIAMASFALIAHVYLNPAGLIGKMLCFRPLAWLGRISYGVYLYHIVVRNTVMSWLHTDSEHKAFVVGMPITLLLSWLSFTYYESPIIAWGRQRAERLGQTPDRGGEAASEATGLIVSRKVEQTDSPRYADANSAATADTRRSTTTVTLPDYIGSEGI